MSQSGSFSKLKHTLTSDKQMLSVWFFLQKLYAGHTAANQII